MQFLLGGVNYVFFLTANVNMTGTKSNGLMHNPISCNCAIIHVVH